MLLLVPIAFISGILTVFSPCILPILPIILASGIDGNTKRINGLIAGLVVSFTIASLLLATIVRVFGIPADIIRTISVVLLVIFGLSLVFYPAWNKIQAWLETYWHFSPVQSKNKGFWGGFLTGISLGIIWTPCIGPILAAVATLAAVSSFSFTAAFISLAYALGAGLPLYLIARGGGKFTARLGVVKSHSQKIRQIFGLIMLATALFIYSGQDRQFQAWTLQHLPDSWVNITTTFESQLGIDDQLRELRDQSDPADL